MSKRTLEQKRLQRPSERTGRGKSAPFIPNAAAPPPRKRKGKG